jgi:hypothetical protein
MYKRVLIIAAVTSALGAAWVRAQEANAVNTAIRNAVISGSLSSPTAGPTANGACSSTGYAAMCPGGACLCATVTAAKVTGSLAGTEAANVSITVDKADATTDISGATCQPIFGTADVTPIAGKNKSPKTETLNLLGVYCNKLKSGQPNTISGGFGIAASPAPSPAASGWGTMTGTDHHGTLKLNLKGPITQ